MKSETHLRGPPPSQLRPLHLRFIGSLMHRADLSNWLWGEGWPVGKLPGGGGVNVPSVLF